MTSHHHRQRLHCVNGDRLNQWRIREWQISTPYRIETPEPIDIKFGTGIASGRRDALCQIWCKSLHWGLLRK